jgi:TPR repeat protein
MHSHESLPRAGALAWFARAAACGDAYAQFNLGMMYKDGDGAPRDDVAACRWLERAARQRLAFAQNHLGSMYFLGRGVAQSDH